jgi:hypothetical protein
MGKASGGVWGTAGERLDRVDSATVVARHGGRFATRWLLHPDIVAAR